MSYILILMSFQTIYSINYGSREATFFFCLSSISSKWLQLKVQEQREKLASREKIRSWKTGLKAAALVKFPIPPVCFYSQF